MILLNKFKLLLILMLILFFAGCAPQGSKPLSEMTDKEKSVIMFNVYNQQYTDYMTRTGFTKIEGEWEKINSVSLTDDQKVIMKKKKEILKGVYPLILLYDSFVINNRAVDTKIEAQIFSLLDSLVLLIPD